MSLTAKTAYLRGLIDGMGLKAENSDEHKLLLVIADLLDDIAVNVETNNESISALADELDELDDAVTGLEERLEDMDDEDEDDDEYDEDEAEYELECPECGGDVTLLESQLDDENTVCPHCGKTLEIDVGFEDEDEEKAPEADEEEPEEEEHADGIHCQLECPECGEMIELVLDQQVLDSGKAVCPSCKKDLELEIEFGDEDDEDDEDESDEGWVDADEEDEDSFELECPDCGHLFELTQEEIEAGRATCPNCRLEMELEGEED